MGSEVFTIRKMAHGAGKAGRGKKEEREGQQRWEGKTRGKGKEGPRSQGGIVL